MTILEDVKNGLMIGDDSFDATLLLEIQSAFSELAQLGVDKASTVPIAASSEWVDYFSELELMLCTSFVIRQVQIRFDMPLTSFQLTAIKEDLEEIKYRIAMHSELGVSDG